MGKVQYIKKARKAWKCGKCGSVIAVGDAYYKGEINFGPTIVRCCKCGLKHWEVTTSEYSLQVGELVNTWSENYELCDTTPEELSGAVAEIREACQDRLDNMPESLQYGPVGELLQERIDALESAESDLDCIDVDDLKATAVSDHRSDIVADYCDSHEDADEDEVEQQFEDADYEEIMDNAELSEDIKDRIREAFEDALAGEIDSILEQLEY